MPELRPHSGLIVEVPEAEHAVAHHNTTVRVRTTRMPFFDPARKKD